jgi:hypothetical protein
MRHKGDSAHRAHAAAQMRRIEQRSHTDAEGARGERTAGPSERVASFARPRKSDSEARRTFVRKRRGAMQRTSIRFRNTCESTDLLCAMLCETETFGFGEEGVHNVRGRRRIREVQVFISRICSLGCCCCCCCSPPLQYGGYLPRLSALRHKTCGAPPQSDSSSNRTSGGLQRVAARALQHSSFTTALRVAVPQAQPAPAPLPRALARRRPCASRLT